MMATITPVHADEPTEETSVSTEVVTTTTEVKPITTEKKVTTQHKKETEKKKTDKKKQSDKDKKKTDKSKEKDKKNTDKKKNEKDKKKTEIPMPKRAVKKKGCETVQKRIIKKQNQIKKLKKEQKKIQKKINAENQKKEAMQQFYQQYATEQDAQIKLKGQKITTLTKISKEDEKFKNQLLSLANTVHDDRLREIAGEYVFGIRDIDFEDLLQDKNDEVDLNSYLKGKYIAPTQRMQGEISLRDQKIEKLKKEIKEEKKTRFFDPKNVNSISNITVDDAKKMLSGTQLYPEAEAFVKAERIHHVNAVFLMGIAAHESAWGTSRRAREDNNLTGYGVYSDSAKGINKPSKEEGLLATAETLHERYLTPGGSYYEGTSVADVNKHYCVGSEWAGAVVGYAYQLMNKLN